MKKYQDLYLKIFIFFLMVKFSVYLNKLVFVMAVFFLCQNYSAHGMTLLRLMLTQTIGYYL